MDTSAPKFHSSLIQEAVTAATQNFAKADEARNKISDDIKNLESYLQKHAVEIEFNYRIGSPMLATKAHHNCGPQELHEEVLSWSPHQEGRFRLMHELGRFDDRPEPSQFGGTPAGDDHSVICESKPLIETSFDVRYRLYPKLAEFVDALSNAMAVSSDH